jgi:hypothetical protein
MLFRYLHGIRRGRARAKEKVARYAGIWNWAVDWIPESQCGTASDKKVSFFREIVRRGIAIPRL